MKRQLLLLSLLLLSGTAMRAQVRNTDDPDIALDMDIEAKKNTAILKLSTYSRTNQMAAAYIVVTFMDDSVAKLTGRLRNTNKVIPTDVNHGFADRFHSYCELNLTTQQAEMFQQGVKSIQIHMVPKSYFHEWEKDEIGKPLYDRYLQSKENVLFKTEKKKKNNEKKKENR